MKVELYFHWKQYDWEDEGRVVIGVHDETQFDANKILLKVIEIGVPDVTPPSRELVMKHKVAKLEEEKKALQAETHIKLKIIEEKISQLQALEFKE